MAIVNTMLAFSVFTADVVDPPHHRRVVRSSGDGADLLGRYLVVGVVFVAVCWRSLRNKPVPYISIRLAYRRDFGQLEFAFRQCI